MVAGRMPHRSDGVPDAARDLAGEAIRGFHEEVLSGERADVVAIQFGLDVRGLEEVQVALLVAGLLMRIGELEAGGSNVSHH